jgi:hypothetical protein
VPTCAVAVLLALEHGHVGLGRLLLRGRHVHVVVVVVRLCLEGLPIIVVAVEVHDLQIPQRLPVAVLLVVHSGGGKGNDERVYIGREKGGKRVWAYP